MSRQVQWSEVNIDVVWGVLRGKRCIVGGPGTTPTLQLLGLHGWLDNANTFDRLVPFLPPGIEVFVLDFPGHGFSDHLPDGAHYNFMTYAIYVRAVILKLGWKSFAFLGHSLGGLIATIYTALFPENVIAVIQFDFILPFESHDRATTWRLETNLVLKSETNKKPFAVYSEEEALNRLVNSRMDGPNKDVFNVGEDAAAVLLPRSTRRVVDGLTWVHDRKARSKFEMLFSNDTWLYFVAHIKCPVLLLRATRGICFHSDSRYNLILDTYQANAQKFDYKFVEGGHHVHLTHPLRVVPSVNEFISNIMHMQNHVISKL